MGPDLYHLLIALVIGAIIGAEREYRSKSAGLRTMIMVSLSSCLFTILSIKIGVENPLLLILQPTGAPTAKCWKKPC